METIFGWQFLIFITIVIARFLSIQMMITIAICWTIFTFVMVYAHFLMLIQLFTIWGTVWLFSILFESHGENEHHPIITAEEKSLLEEETVKKSNYKDLISSLYKLEIYINSILKYTETKKSLLKKFAENPDFEIIYRENNKRLWALFENDDQYKRKLYFPLIDTDKISIENIPIEKTDIFIEECNKVLFLLKKAFNELTTDEKLLKEMEPILPEPFIPYLSEQIEKIVQAIAHLAPTEAAHTEKLNVNIVSVNGSKESHHKKQFLVSQQAKGKSDLSELKNDSLIESLVETFYDKNKIAEIVHELKIPYLVHFTRCENLPSILKHGLMSVCASNSKGFLPLRNDIHRYDDQLDGTSLSIAFPNYRMFWKYRQLSPTADWAVLIISPKVLWEKDCAFYRYNAADARMSRSNHDKKKSYRALREMFWKERKPDNFLEYYERDSWLCSFDPTDPQAEVMVYDLIEPDLIEAIAFETAEAKARNIIHIAGYDSFYTGKNNGFFGTRKHTRKKSLGTFNGIQARIF